MRGKQLAAVGMLLLFILTTLSLWIPIPHNLIRGVSLSVFAMSAVRNCIYYRKKKGYHSIGLWSLGIGCILIASVSMLKENLLWKVLYIISFYLFFLVAELLLHGKFRIGYWLLGTTTVGMILVREWTDCVWVQQVIFMIQMIFLLRLLNPILEETARRGKEQRMAKEQEEKNISPLRRILFGRSGRLRIPGISARREK